MKKVFSTVAVLLFIFVQVKAQPYYFRHYQVENGLSHNTVFCSAQDKTGFLWFGTKDGLNRFDGYHFKTVNIRKQQAGTLTRDLIFSLATDATGTLWVGTQNGLFHYQREKESFIPFLDSLHNINDIFFDKKGQLWFTADFTLNCYNFQTKKTTSFPEEWFFSASSMCETKEGTMWFSTTDGYLERFDASKQTFTRYNLFKHSPPAESNAIQKIIYDNNGSILIGTSNQGIKRFDLSKLDYTDILIYNPDRTTIFVRDILQVSDKETWFATESGIFIWNNTLEKFVNLKKKFLDPYSLSDNAVYTLNKDTEGGIWAGTYFGGLNYFPKQDITFQKYFPDYSPNSISGNAVREICEDNRGNIWFGTEDAGLNKLQRKTGVITHFEPTGKPGSIAYSNIHGLLVVKDELWIGTFEHGFDIVDIVAGKAKSHHMAGAGPNDLKSNFIISFLQTRDGDIYLGTSNGICQYDRKKNNFVYPKGIAEGSFVSCMLEDHDGMIWVATHNRGLFCFNPLTGSKGHFQNEPGNENSLTNNWINSLYEDSYQNLWISTEGGGVCVLDKKRKSFSRYSTRNGLPSNFVFKVLEDNNRTIWLTTSKGLVNLTKSQNKITVYTKANGLLNDQFNYNSGYKDKQGNLYFGSVQGMIQFNPDAFHTNQFIPPIYITGLQVQNREVDLAQNSGVLKKSIVLTDKITLPYDQSSFSIDFAALSFTSPETTEYSYIMNGLDREWTYLKSNRKVYFTNLKPGSYTFIVKAGNNGVWNGKIKELTFVITPPFWATTWAYLLYALFSIMLIYYLVRTYHQIQENKKAKEIYQAKIEFFTNIAHEIKTPLTLIKGPVENLNEMVELLPEIKDDVSTMERNTNRLLNLVNQILDFRQTETTGFSLDFSEVNINDVLHEAYVTFQPLAKKRNLDYKLEEPPAAVQIMGDVEALTKVFHNLFSNSVKYAQKQVKVKLYSPDLDTKKLTIEFRNDGHLIPSDMKEKIFEPFFRIKEATKQKGTGLGLALARSLAELHGGKIYVKEDELNCNLFVVELPCSSLSNKKKTQTEISRQID